MRTVTGGISYAFGPFVLDSKRRQLLAEGERVPLGTRATDLLLLLVARHGTEVGKQEIFDTVWPNRRVEENNLTVHISAMRRALRDGRDGHHYVQTISGRGYMFVAPVTRRTTEPAPKLPTGNLPLAATQFVGRTAEMDRIAQRLTRHRLVTIAGVGGIGKTRLAFELGRHLAPLYPDGVWVIDVAALPGPSQLAEAVAALFHIGSPADAALARLVEFLRPLTLLLVLDNCDAMIGPAGTFAGALLAGCATLSVLVTSRASLGVTGESVYRLPPLPVPTISDDLSAADAIAHDSVRLLVDRARDIDGDFVLDDANAAAIARICGRLDGIALAIEMAVPRLLVLQPAQLADRLNERFRLLTGPGRSALPRHRTLRAMIDWSYELLDPAERLLLQRLSVFAGGATLDAIAAIAAPETDRAGEDWRALDVLASLVDKSLVVADFAQAEPRYRLLETIRAYAGEKLLDSGDTALPARHAGYFAQFFAQAEAAWPRAVTAAWLQIYGEDTDNLRAALTWAFGPTGDPALALRLVAASYPLWWDLPELPLHESRRWFDRAAAAITPDTPPGIAARLWFGLSWRDVRFGDRENYPAAAQAVALFRQAGDALGLGAALWRAGSALLTAETADEAAIYFTEAESVLRAHGPTKWLALCMVKQGDLRFRRGELDDALAAYEEAMRITGTTGNWYGLMNGGSNMAELLFHRGERDAALAQLLRLRDTLAPGRRTPLVATLAAHLLLANRPNEARDAAREALVYARAIGLPAASAWTIEMLGLLLAQQGDIEQAARFAGHARAVHRSIATRAGSRRAVFEQLDAHLAAALNPSARESLAQQGALWTPATATEAALVVCG